MGTHLTRTVSEIIGFEVSFYDLIFFGICAYVVIGIGYVTFLTISAGIFDILERRRLNKELDRVIGKEMREKLQRNGDV